MKTTSAALASAAALLFLAGAGAGAPAAAADEAGSKVKCEGVNSCKGHSDCKTLLSECAQKNSCKGKGFKMLTPEECEAAKARMEQADDAEES